MKRSAGIVLLTTTFALVGPLFMGCASSSRPLSVAIQPLKDSVPLVRNPEAASFQISVVVRNNESRPIYLVGCGPSAEREIGGSWTTVFNPSCLTPNTKTVSANDSVEIPVLLYGYTNGGPTLDPRALPGRYRLIFYVQVQDPSSGALSPFGGEKIPSTPFVLTN